MDRQRRLSLSSHGPLLLLYVGLSFVLLPAVMGFESPLALIGEAGWVIATAGIVWFFARRIEERFDRLDRKQVELKELSVRDITVVNRYELVRLLSRFGGRSARLVVNCDAFPLVIDVVEQLEGRGTTKLALLLCEFSADNTERADAGRLLHELQSFADRGVEVRVVAGRVASSTLISPEHAVLISGLSRRGDVYSYIAVERWSQVAREIERDVEELWRESTPHENPK